QPGLSDYVIGIKNNGMAALAGAALVKAATGEETDDQSLGGAEMHSKVTGLVEYLAENDEEGIQIARDLVEDLGWEKSKILPNENVEEPLLPADEILGLIPPDFKNSYDVRELIFRLVDGSSFREFKSGYGISTVCTTGYFFGYSCGIVSNNGPIDPDGATKATQFIQLCDQVNKPIIFLSNTTGFLVGKKYEHAGMIKHGSKMIQAVMNVRVPKISFYIGASFGAGNYGMCGFEFNPDFLFTWPNAKIGVMGGQQASLTMENVITRASLRKGNKINKNDLKMKLNQVKNHFDKQSNAFYTSGRLLDNGMIDPRDTRKVIGICLSICLDSRTRVLHSNTFGVARP
ncbi:MAG: acyl-CoA carboxylase subunit beta, partial [Paracoccaceae bacterium]